MIQAKMQVSGNDTSFQMLPLDFHDQPVPLVKIYSIGGLRIEVLQQPADTPPHARYAPAVSLSGRGVMPAQMLLRHLLSASQHFCSLDWLNEHWYGTDELPARLDNRASALRGLLCPSYLQGEQRENCRKQLVSFVGGSQESGNGYRLGAYPLIWIDLDALDWNVQHACRMERYADDALPFWERAYHLASPGVYLPEETYSQWAEPRRFAVTGALRQSVHALKRLYLLRHGEQGQAESMRLLRDYLVPFPTDQDALRSLMELLAGQERFQEMEQVLTRTQHSIEEEGLTLDAHTLDLWEYLRTKQIRRQGGGERSPVSQASPSEQGNSIALFPHLSEAITAGIVKAMERVEQKKREASANGSESL